VGTRLIAVLTDPAVDPGPWARDREAEGWSGVAASDHVFIGGRALPHLWVTVTEMAVATSRLSVATCFANNLLRSPVEFAQASLSAQRASGGRFEAGLGAGWDREEMAASGMVFPEEASERAGRYIEAVRIVRELFDRRSATRSGAWYAVDVPTIGPDVPSPPLVVSVGGPRTTAALAPIADIVELKLPGYATTGKGALHVRTLRSVSLDDIRARIDESQALAPDAELALFVSAACGDDPIVASIRVALQGSFSEHLFGEPAEVADTLASLAALGVQRLTVGAVTSSTYPALAAQFPIA